MNVRQVFLALALFLSSAGGLVIEIVAGRLIAPYVGMSLYTWTAIIAVVLAGLSAGHWIGGRLAGSRVEGASADRRLAAALALASASSLASLVLLRVLSGPLLGSGLGPVPVVVILSTALFLLPSLFVGIVAPILTKLAVDANPRDPGPIIGRMYALGTLGSIAGTLSAGYVFISWIGSIGTVLSVSAVYALLAVAFALRRFRPGGVAVVIVFAGAMGLLALWGGAVKAFQTPCTRESDYFCIRIDDFSASSGRPSALMALDHLVHSINDRDDPRLLYSPYIHFVDEFARRHLGWQSPDQEFAAYFIGGGGFSLPRAWAADFPRSDLSVAEIDPAVTEAAAAGMWLDRSLPAVRIRHRDARADLQSLPAGPAFDVVFGDAFRDISIPAHLVTREFHGEIAKRLRPGGFYTLNVVDSAAEPRFLAALVKTLKLDFAAVEVWAEAEELFSGLSGDGWRVTYIVVAGDTESGMDRLTARRGVERQWRRWPLAELERRVAVAVPVLTDDYAPVDRLMSTLLLASDD